MIEKYAPLIERALADAGNTHTVGDVAELVAAGKAWLVPLDKSVMVCDLMHCPQEDIWRYWLAAGDLQELVYHEEGVSRWAQKRFGARRAMIFGRPGWSKIFAPTYKETHRVLLRNLD